MQDIIDILNIAPTAKTETLLVSLLLTIGVGFLLGLLISFVYIKTGKNGTYNQSYVLTLILVTIVIGVIIIMVGNNVARAFSLAGAFSLIRFRNAPAESRDIAFVFFAMAAGLGCGVGLHIYSAIFVILVTAIIFLVYKLNYGTFEGKILKIVIPEDMSYKGVFDEVIDKYTVSNNLAKVRTTALGTLYELVFHVVTRADIDEKAMIDEIRCLNGNLEVSLILTPQVDK